MTLIPSEASTLEEGVQRSEINTREPHAYGRHTGERPTSLCLSVSDASPYLSLLVFLSLPQHTPQLQQYFFIISWMKLCSVVRLLRASEGYLVIEGPPNAALLHHSSRLHRLFFPLRHGNSCKNKAIAP